MTSIINAPKLRAKMYERNINMSEMAKRISIDPSSMSRKMKGNNDFTVGEMQAIVNELQMSADEAVDIFLSKISQ